jgi:para-aminobenzoate synthetase component II
MTEEGHKIIENFIQISKSFKENKDD